ncbi:MAG: VC_2705 family sodium/solute symporter [Rhodospirillales bacterium]|nr:VC_2705 family sodium/solute symporter [Rhodospirillales bacterium]
MIAYLGGFAVFLSLTAILEQMGVPNRLLGLAFFILPLVGYVIVGIRSRPTHLSDFYVAGRRVPAFYNGMASAAAWMSAASFVGFAGSLFLLGYDGLAFFLGWTAGFVLLAVLIVPYLRRSGAITVPEFLASRYESVAIRFLSILIVLACLFAFLVAQIYACGLITSRFLGIDFALSIYFGFGVVALCSVLGGMRSVTWTQVAQYVVMIVAYVVPIAIVSMQRYGIPIPYLTYGQALHEVSALEHSLSVAGLADQASLRAHIVPFQSYGVTNFVALAASMMVGSAVMPHILTRYVTTPTVHEARSSVVWTFVFVLALYLAIPAYSAFFKHTIYSSVVGKTVEQTPPWIYTWGSLGLVRICGVNALNVDAVVSACKSIAGHPGVLRLQDMAINTDVIVLSMPELSGMPYVVSGLMAAGALAAAISTATALLITMSTALSHDLYYRIIDKTAKPNRRLLVARGVVMVVAIIGAVKAAEKPSDVLAMVGWAFSLSGSSLFAPLVLGIWWKRANTAGALAGMVVGFCVCLLYLVAARYYPVFGVTHLGMTSLLHAVTGAPLVDIAKVLADGRWSDPSVAATFAHPLANKVGWFGINPISAAVFGVPAALITTVVVSKLTGQPGQTAQDFVYDIRSPDTETLFADGGDDRARL